MNSNGRALGLHVLVKPLQNNTEQIALSAAQARVSIVQYWAMREPLSELVQEAGKLKQLLRQHGNGKPALIINDSPDVNSVKIALAAGADGVHLGQEDWPKYGRTQIQALANVRLALGKNAVIGISASTPEQAREALMSGADYIGTGAIFPSTSVTDYQVIGIETLAEIARLAKTKIVAIGGITPQTCESVLPHCQGVAVYGCIARSENPFTVIQEIIEKLENK